MANYENRFGVTISRKRINVLDLSQNISPINITDEEALLQAVNPVYTLPVINMSKNGCYLVGRTTGRNAGQTN